MNKVSKILHAHMTSPVLYSTSNIQT